MEKICSKCGDSFFKERHGRVCQKCINAKQRVDRALSGNKYTKHYEKTEKGFVMRMYRNMLSRIRGIQKRSSYLYIGKEIMNKSQFYEWCLNNSDFKRIFNYYSDSGFDMQKAPSIDRIDSSIGYVPDNIRIITHYENSINALNIAQYRRKSGLIQRPSMRRFGHSVTLVPAEVTEIRKRKSTGESVLVLSDEFKTSVANIYAICSGKSWKHLLSDN